MAATDAWAIEDESDTELAALDTSGNLQLAGTLTVDSTTTATGEITASAGIALPDSQAITFGTGDDAALTHDGTTGLDLTVAASDAGALTVSDGTTTYLTVDSTSSQLDLAARVTTTDGVTSGTARVVGGRAFSSTAASSAVTNTTTETDFDVSYTIPANTLKAGTVVKVRGWGTVTGATSTDELQIIWKLGSTAILTGTSTNATTNDIFTFEAEINVRTAGTSGTFMTTGSYNDVGTAGNPTVFTKASTAVDTTASLAVKATATWSVAATANSCRLEQLVVEIY